MIKQVCILISSLALFLLGVNATFHYYEFMINRKEAAATVIYSERVSIKNLRDFRLAIKYANQYRNDMCVDTVLYKSDHSQSIPDNITVIYSKNSQALFVAGQKRTTWGLVIFTTIGTILVLASAIVSIKKMLQSDY